MAFTLSGTTITQSGVDTDLSGLSGITGVIVTQKGVFTEYDIGSNILVVEGILSIADVTDERLVITGDNGNNNNKLRVSSTGVLYVGEHIDDATEQYDRNKAITVIETLGSISDNPTGFNGGQINGRKSGLAVDNGGQCFIRGVAVSFFTGIGANGELHIKNATVYAKDIYPYNANSTFENSITVTANGSINYLASFATFTGVQQNDLSNGTYLNVSGSTPSLTADVRNVPAFNYPQFSRGGSNNNPTYNIINAGLGSGYNFANDLTGSSRDFRQYFFREVAGTFYDPDGLGANGVFRILGNGTYDKTIVVSSGVAPLTSVELAEVIAVNGPFTETYHSKNSDNTDLYDWYFASYKYDILFGEISLKGNDPLDLTRTPLVDTMVTEQDQAVVQAYTSQENPSKVYDSLKSFLVDNFTNQTEKFAITDLGRTVVDTGTYDVIVDGGAGFPTVSGNVITIYTDGQPYTGDIIGNVISTTNGGSVKGLITDGNLDSIFEFVSITNWEIYPTVNDRTNKTNLIAQGTGDEVYHFKNTGVDYFFAVTTTTGTEVNISRLGSLSEYETGKNEISLDNTSLILACIEGIEQLMEKARTLLANVIFWNKNPSNKSSS